MATDITLGPISQVPPGEGRVFEWGMLKVAVFHDRDRTLYATQPNCPHRGGPLADGLFGSGRLVCPLHDWVFDLRTGTGPRDGCRLRTYPARLDGEQIIVTVAE